MKFVRTAALFLAAIAGAASAHDSWLEPKSFHAPAGATVPVTFYVGHHGHQRSVTLSSRPRWLLSMRSTGPAQSTDLLKSERFDPKAGIGLGSDGTYLLSLDTADFRQSASPAKFEEYLEEEGLAAAQAQWRRAPVRSRNVRESYRRHAKSLIQAGEAGSAPQPAATIRLGQRLEIVPSLDPHRLRAGEQLALAVWFRDRALPGAQVTLSSLDRPKDKPLTTRSDSNGEAGFRLPSAGRWLVDVVWSEPSKEPGIDYQTSFASLTFAVPERR